MIVAQVVSPAGTAAIKAGMPRNSRRKTRCTTNMSVASIGIGPPECSTTPNVGLFRGFDRFFGLSPRLTAAMRLRRQHQKRSHQKAQRADERARVGKHG